MNESKRFVYYTCIVFHQNRLLLLMKKYFILLFFVLNIYTLLAQKKCNAVSIYFESNKCVLTRENTIEIKRVVSGVSPFKIAGVIIEGRSDTTGSEKANLILSQKRIDAALRSLKPLLDKNIPVESKNYGESNPASLTDMHRNRSIKIIFILDTLVNLAKQGEGEIWLNTKLLGYMDSCNFTLRVTPYINSYYNPAYYTYIPLSAKTGIVYKVQTFYNCFDVYIFPDSFYNPITHIGRFVPPADIWYCSADVDSINFSANTNMIQYDSISKNYYIITDCKTPGGACCAGAKKYCHSYTFVPEQTITHVTTLPYISDDYGLDTILVENEHVWQDWGCASSLKISLDSTPYLYSLAMFDSAYYYLKGKITQYRRTDTTTFEFLGEKYQTYEKIQIYQLQQKDYTSFASPTSKRLFVKTEPGYVPGYYLKEYDTLIPFEQIGKRKYRGFIIDFPTEFGLQQSDTIITQKDLRIRKRERKSATVFKIRFK